MLSGLVCVHVIAAALSRLYTQGKWSWQFLKLRTGGSQHTPLFWEELVQLLFCIWWPLSPTSPWCPWCSRSEIIPPPAAALSTFSSRAIVTLNSFSGTADSSQPREGEKVFHHRNRSRARRNHINCKCSAINAKAKMDDNTNANMIYSNLQSKDSLLNRDPIHKTY